MKLAYEKIIEENKLDLENLPADIQKMISDIKRSKGLIQTKVEVGEDVKETTIENLKSKDADLVEKLLDHLEIDSDSDDDNDDSDDDSDDNENDDDSDEEGNEDDNEGGNEEENMLDVSKYDGNKIDTELSSLLDQGISEINFNDIRSACPHTYELIFEAYEANKENGVRTPFYEMIETQPNSETFKITKL